MLNQLHGARIRESLVALDRRCHKLSHDVHYINDINPVQRAFLLTAYTCGAGSGLWLVPPSEHVHEPWYFRGFSLTITKKLPNTYSVTNVCSPSILIFRFNASKVESFDMSQLLQVIEAARPLEPPCDMEAIQRCSLASSPTVTLLTDYDSFQGSPTVSRFKLMTALYSVWAQ